jgi:GT2 family glycosyltransferase
LREEEKRLAAAARAITVSSESLLRKWSGREGVTLLRNAADYEHFATPRSESRLLDVPRPVIGYYGAIAEWFDAALVRDVAKSRPDYSFVLIGDALDPEAAALRELSNVVLPGEKPYQLMPAYLAGFDVCMIPFQITPLTAATDPVKLYEYFSQGKPVVATLLPELRRHEPLVALAGDAMSFAAAIDRALHEDPELRARRVEVAGANTWRDRGKALEEVCREASPLVSIIVVTYDNVEYTRLCLESVLRNTHAPRFEVIVVDNASSDSTREYLVSLGPVVRVLLNERNEGFARANNQGIAASSGDFLILLNNDTVVPPGWSCRLVRHLGAPAAGLVVSVTNFSGNESRIEVTYRDLEEMETFASRRAVERDGERFDLPVAAMYCVGMRRDVFERVGPLDERFTIGMFEDDDYSQRVRDAGLRVLCAEDAFVHHFGQASFKKLGQSEYFDLFERNRKLFEEKWGRPWLPHKER